MAVTPTTPPLSTLPPPPLPTDAEATFDAKAGASLTAQIQMVAEVNVALTWQAASMAATLDYKNAAALSANAAAASATTAAAQVGLAAAQVALATNAKDQAGVYANSSLTYAQAAGAAAGIPDAVPSSALFTDDAGNAYWGKAGIVRSIRTANNQLMSSDRSTLIEITSGTFTQTFAAASTLGPGWFCYFQNSGTGDITLDPNAAETIDGLTSFVMYPGEARLITCDGTALKSMVLNAFSKVFTASGTFIKPPGYRRFEGMLWSGGGSGRKGGNDAWGGSGSGATPFGLQESAIPSSAAVVIGSGGAPATSPNTNGNAGGQSTFLSIYAERGLGGNVSSQGGGRAVSPSLGNGLTMVAGASSATDSFYGGGAGRSTSAGISFGNTVYGGAAGGWIETGVVNLNPSLTIYGGMGGTASLNNSGQDGVAPGGGGGSTQTGTQSGAGARGELRIMGVV